jgi:alpha-tubulin suppressor-like RCC1 family protein
MAKHIKNLMAIILLATLAVGCSIHSSIDSLSVASVDETPSTPLPESPSTPETPATPVVSYITKKIAVGTDKVFSINTSGVAKCWGSNYDAINGVYGQLGLGLSTNTTFNSPQSLDAGINYLSIVSGEILSCGITTGKRVRCWGDGVGDGSGAAKNSPVYINDGGTDTYNDISSGSYHTCAISSSGVVKCWGDGWDGKLGNADATGAGQASPVTADPGTTYKRIAAGRNHTCGITSSDEIKCWGTNDHGQIGVGTLVTPKLTPQAVDVGVKYKEIFAGEDSNCAITTAGVLKCWGFNSDGQLGDNTIVNKLVPTEIDSGTTYSRVSLAGTYFYHSCGVTTAGVLKCWGNNSAGQLGVNGTTPSRVPVVVDSGTTYREVSVTFRVSCGITTGGVLKCWGNSSVQVGPQVVGSGY